ncbi:Alkaline phosphatase synthesis transcriptional regulatory protein PhoP [Clostridium liquoris]|jgi:DNA-binding response OmpR family regulator|uniref:Stage 0 sporulation protein A homolog n=1 Tax=Clostridium liquoris TaxID=1289519 RepID=A0A2T0B2E8_9CLOT|nr:response regulator transcription factor [Clostridium liquoris]PRR78074.1 Alkaline phosphatase synthesis transcriptional regulatory protein PhoP [Clostridium liquoris]
MNKILIVEDEMSIRSFLKINFERNNFIVIEAESGEEGIRKAKLEKPEIAILDVMLPGIDGFKVCKVLRGEFQSMGIIMLTARSQDMDKIMGLEFGADDYVVKPFNPSELILRVKALLRRMEPLENEKDNSIHSGPFKIDTYSQKVYKDNEEIDVTPREYLLMKIFVENEDKAFSRDELLDLVWGYNFVGDSKIVDVNIRRLRAKIENDPSNPTYIETIWGKGYRWRKS